ncbi:hypothetical protein EDC94DRAFT_693197 [Helicostylum pulchrum]|nr:hypothetical protein EDC94DRAFT_693197 [Helicostylum pulchrum]
MLCGPDQTFTCPDTVCGDLKFSVCSWTTTDNVTVTYDGCSDTSHLNCADDAFRTCFMLRMYVSKNGVNNTLPAGNQIANCESLGEILPFVKPLPTASATTLNQANFILVLVFICLLTVSLARKF